MWKRFQPGECPSRGISVIVQLHRLIVYSTSSWCRCGPRACAPCTPPAPHSHCSSYSVEIPLKRNSQTCSFCRKLLSHLHSKFWCLHFSHVQNRASRVSCNGWLFPPAFWSAPGCPERCCECQTGTCQQSSQWWAPAPAGTSGPSHHLSSPTPTMHSGWRIYRAWGHKIDIKLT